LNQLNLESSTGTSQIYIGESLKNLSEYLSNEKTVIITDKNVCNLHSSFFPPYKTIKIGQGEKIKTLKIVETIYQTFLGLELDRASCNVAIGGGVVCDIAGFCASTYMIGLRFGFVPSTLVARVDASIGGKKGVNFKGYKNIIKVFRRAQFILVDTALLKALAEREFLGVVSEMIKSALIQSSDLFETLEERWQKLLSQEKSILDKVITDTITLKAHVVQTDAVESGERRKLNFGHTLGHACEKQRTIPHGEAVSIEMALATDLSVAKGLLAQDEASRIKTLLQKINLPTQIQSNINSISLMDAMKKDKKRRQEDIHFVLLTEIGKAKIMKISYQQLKEHIHDLSKHCCIHS
jgi:3-dehydroquinate synthase